MAAYSAFGGRTGLVAVLLLKQAVPLARTRDQGNGIEDRDRGYMYGSEYRNDPPFSIAVCMMLDMCQCMDGQRREARQTAEKGATDA